MLLPGAGVRRESRFPTLATEAQNQKNASDSHKVFLCVLHGVQSLRAGMEKLLA